ncbi:hypothetical protein ABEF95_009383 [Exophiala dermatitidis]
MAKDNPTPERAPPSRSLPTTETWSDLNYVNHLYPEIGTHEAYLHRRTSEDRVIANLEIHRPPHHNTHSPRREMLLEGGVQYHKAMLRWHQKRLKRVLRDGLDSDAIDTWPPQAQTSMEQIDPALFGVHDAVAEAVEATGSERVSELQEAADYQYALEVQAAEWVEAPPHGQQGLRSPEALDYEHTPATQDATRVQSPVEPEQSPESQQDTESESDHEAQVARQFLLDMQGIVAEKAKDAYLPVPEFDPFGEVRAAQKPLYPDPLLGRPVLASEVVHDQMPLEGTGQPEATRKRAHVNAPVSSRTRAKTLAPVEGARPNTPMIPGNVEEEGQASLPQALGLHGMPEGDQSATTVNPDVLATGGGSSETPQVPSLQDLQPSSVFPGAFWSDWLSDFPPASGPSLSHFDYRPQTPPELHPQSNSGSHRQNYSSSLRPHVPYPGEQSETFTSTWSLADEIRRSNAMSAASSGNPNVDMSLGATTAPPSYMPESRLGIKLTFSLAKNYGPSGLGPDADEGRPITPPAPGYRRKTYVEKSLAEKFGIILDESSGSESEDEPEGEQVGFSTESGSDSNSNSESGSERSPRPKDDSPKTRARKALGPISPKSHARYMAANKDPAKHIPDPAIIAKLQKLARKDLKRKAKKENPEAEEASPKAKSRRLGPKRT